MKKRLLSYFFLFLIWLLLAIYINNDIILPHPLDVFAYFSHTLFSLKTYTAIFTTLGRVFLSLLISFFTSFFLATICYFKPKIKEYFAPINDLIKSIPNISIMFIVLLVFGRVLAPIIIVFLITFPLMYNIIYKGYICFDSELQAALALFGEKFLTNLYKVYLPLIKEDLKLALASGSSLGLKVCVMAEILGQVNQGIGKQLYINKINLDMIGVFSWTIWIIILVGLIELLISSFK